MPEFYLLCHAIKTCHSWHLALNYTSYKTYCCIVIPFIVCLNVQQNKIKNFQDLSVIQSYASRWPLKLHKIQIKRLRKWYSIFPQGLDEETGSLIQTYWSAAHLFGRIRVPAFRSWGKPRCFAKVSEGGREIYWNQYGSLLKLVNTASKKHLLWMIH